MIKKASVKEIIKIWEKGGITAVQAFLNEVGVFENTWAEKIKNLLEEDHIKSVTEEIELVAFNLDLRNKLYNPKKKSSGYEKNT